MKIDNNDEEVISPISTRSYESYPLEWENIDWMPTPKGQSKIPSPWSGAGSIASIWGLDVVNDRYKKDGWVLVYNTFSTNLENIKNPYFVLYNRYNGILRMYLYINTQFLYPASYIQDGITLLTNKNINTLEYNGSSWIDNRKSSTHNLSYGQIQPNSIDGSLPLATNRWYMLQYEMQFNDNIVKYNTEEVMMSWYLNFYNVQTINLGGKIEGTIKSAVGSKNNDFFKSLGSTGKALGTGAIAGVGYSFLEKNKKDDKGNNKLGLPKEIFKSVNSGVLDAVKSSGKDLPGAIFGLFNAVFFSKNNNSNLVNLVLDADIKLDGTGKEGGSFPSSPIVMILPGTHILPNSTGMIPSYNKPLGVFSKNADIFKAKGRCWIDEGGTTIEITNCDEFLLKDNSYHKNNKSLIINSDVLNIADVEIKKVDLVFYPFIHPDNYRAVNNKIKCQNIEIIDQRNELMHIKAPGVQFNGKKIQYCYINPKEIFCDYSGAHFSKEEFMFGLRYTIQVKPKNGSSIHTIVKTFRMDIDLDGLKYFY